MKTSAQTLIKELYAAAVVMDKDSERETSFQRKAEPELQARRRDVQFDREPFPAYCGGTVIVYICIVSRAEIFLKPAFALKPSFVWGLGDEVRRISSTF